MPNLFFNHFWPGMLLWVALYISDYALTLVCARLYRAQNTVVFEGSYELTPFFQRDIDSSRVVSPRFVWILLLTMGMFGFLWILNKQSAVPELYQFALGALIVVQFVVHIRHLRNLFLYQTINHTRLINGRIEYGRALLVQISSRECFAFSVMFLMLFVFTKSWFILGGATGCLSLAVKHHKLASKLKTHPSRVESSPEQATNLSNPA